HGAMQPERASPLFIQLADALAVVHAQGITHGSIHPGNIVLRPAGAEGQEVHPVLVGFRLGADCLLRRCSVGNSTNQRLFTAPEQRYREADARSDIYSLAAVFYHTLVYHDAERRDPGKFNHKLLPFGLRKPLAKAMGGPESRPADS